MIYNTNLLISKYNCASLSLFYLRDFYLDLFDTEFGDAIRQMEVNVYVRFDPADRPYKVESNAWLDTRKLDKPKVRFLPSNHILKVQYITSILGAEREFPIVGTIRQNEEDQLDTNSFSAYCLEFIDILLKNFPKALNQNDNFDAKRFVEHLKNKRAGLPITEETLEGLKKAKKEFDYERVRWIYSATSGTGSKQIPKAIPIQYDATHTPIIGKFNGGQFWGLVTEGFDLSKNAKNHSNYVYSVLHTFDRSGKHIKTCWEKTFVDDKEKAFQVADRKLMDLLASYESCKFCSIKIGPFQATVDEMTFGLIDRSDEESAKVEMAPLGYMLFPPWTGHFDT